MKKLIIAVLFIAAPAFADKCHTQKEGGQKVTTCVTRDGAIYVKTPPTFEQRMQAAELANIQLQNANLARQAFTPAPIHVEVPFVAPPPPPAPLKLPQAVNCTSQVIGNQLQTVCY